MSYIDAKRTVIHILYYQRRKPARVRGNVRAAVDTERKKLASAKFES
jgi:hypothetical protein